METDKDTAASGEKNPTIDPKSVLLPKKGVDTSASASRVNAGILFEQEASARREGTEPTSAAQETSDATAPSPQPKRAIKTTQKYNNSNNKLTN